jgi:hypothetical protein
VKYRNDPKLLLFDYYNDQKLCFLSHNTDFENKYKLSIGAIFCTSATDSGIFIEFMLGEILSTLKYRQGEPLEIINNVGVNNELEPIIGLIKQFPGINATQLAKHIPEKTKRTIERQLAVLKNNNRVEFKGSPKSDGYYLKTND